VFAACALDPCPRTHHTLVRNSPFVTKIGVGQVIKGWDEGMQNFFLLSFVLLVLKSSRFTLAVPQLSIGEKALIVVTPDFVRNFTLRTHPAI
jgi:hypothetical protein